MILYIEMVIRKIESQLAAYGDIYQWGRGDDGHESRGSVVG
jgi:hypothetical protein